MAELDEAIARLTVPQTDVEPSGAKIGCNCDVCVLRRKVARLDKLAKLQGQEIRITRERDEALEIALQRIWTIVHTPTKDTRHRTADDHFQADFDSIRKIIAGTGVHVGGALKP